MAWEGPRMVKVYVDEEPFHVHLVLVDTPETLARLSEALREYVRLDTDYIERDGPEPGNLVEFLEARQFRLPCTYSAHWPFEGDLGE